MVEVPCATVRTAENGCIFIPRQRRQHGVFDTIINDERILQFISKLTEMHTDPEISNPSRIETTQVGLGKFEEP